MEYDEIEIIERLKNRLQIIGINYEEFCDFLVENQVFLSGSFLLQVIGNNYFNDEYDIDIFTFGKNNLKIENNMKNFLNKAMLKDYKIIKDMLIGMNVIFPESCMININEPKTELEKFISSILLYYVESDVNYGYNVVEIYHESYKKNPITTSDSYIFYEYTLEKIKSIVEISNDSKKNIKFKIIHYKDTQYEGVEKEVNYFDFDFCVNYFDGKKLYIKNYQSIISKSCVIKCDSLRITENLNVRIQKYCRRGFTFNVNHNQDNYEVVYLDYMNNLMYEDEKNIKKLTDATNLITFCSEYITNITNYLDNLPSDKLKKIIIYNYPIKTIINNLPCSVQELRVYTKQYYILNNDYHKNNLNNIVSTIKKNPFDCKIFVDDNEINVFDSK
jgi:hypothetical protein